jgi:hypothetical protein
LLVRLDAEERTALVVHDSEFPLLELSTGALAGIDVEQLVRAVGSAHDDATATLGDHVRPFPHVFKKGDPSAIEFVANCIEHRKAEARTPVSAAIIEVLATELELPRWRSTRAIVVRTLWGARHDLGTPLTWLDD